MYFKKAMKKKYELTRVNRIRDHENHKTMKTISIQKKFRRKKDNSKKINIKFDEKNSQKIKL